MSSTPMKKLSYSVFLVPSILILSMVMYLLLRSLNHASTGQTILLLAIFIGSIQLVIDTVTSLFQRRFALDYIALAAIATGVVTQQYLVATVICLMLAGGNALEEYAEQKAKSSLSALVDRIPDKVNIWEKGAIAYQSATAQVKIGQHIAIRKGEVVPLDGELISDEGTFDESSLTGEPYPVNKTIGDQVRSGTVNTGDLVVIEVTRVEKDSTYRKIIDLVNLAQAGKAPLVRLADQYSTWFTLATFSLAALAYFFTRDPQRILAVLVLATPCPLILATPIALIGGMNTAAKRGIVIKNLASLENLAHVKALVFDKTGTLTLGQPNVEKITSRTKAVSENEVLAVAASIERSSLHPIAKAIVSFASKQHVKLYQVHHVEEIVGQGIQGEVRGKVYKLLSSPNQDGISVKLQQGKSVIGEIFLHDTLKSDSQKVLQDLHELGLSLHLLSGDTKERVKKLVKSIGLPISYQAECTPEDKSLIINTLQKEGKVTAMIGDGINDAPALAMADTGIVFSNEEHSASSDAADVVLLGNQLRLVKEIVLISQKTLAIALQSIWIGLGLSIIGMVAASLGYVPPIAGALSQEIIDIAVIINALRASRIAFSSKQT
jgi:heavy metal translocating P-type ATPase